MKKLLLTLAAGIFCAGAAFADATIVIKDQACFNGGGTTMDAPESWTNGDFTFNVAKNDGTTAPAYNKAGDLRLYAKNTFTITATNAMTNVVFDISAQGLKRLTEITASTGTIATQAAGDNTVTWTGNATTVTFTVGEKAIYGSEGETKAGQFDFNQINITGGGETGEQGGGDDPEPGDINGINESFNDGIPAGWTNVKVSGDKEWYGTSFNGTYYAAMTGYKGTQPPFDAWLISPAVDMATAAEKVLSFRTQVNGYGSTTSELNVYVLSSNDPTTATKTQLNPTLAEAPESGYSAWAESGNIDLSAQTGVIYIGFQFYATEDANYATWCLTDVKLNPNGAGEQPVEPTATFELTNAIESGAEYVMAVNVDGTDKLGTAIAASASYGRLTLVDVTIANNNLTADLKDAIVITAEGNGYTLKDANGRYLGFDGTHTTSFQLYNEPGELCIWNISFNGNEAVMTLTAEGNTGTVGVTKGTESWYNNIAPSVGAEEILYPTLYKKGGSSSVAEIVVDENAPVEYYNLQGIRVANPENGLYIRRQGNTVTKVLVK